MLQHVWRISALGWYHLLIFGVFVPYWVIRSRMKMAAAKQPPLNRMKHFRSTSMLLVVFGSLSVLTARDQWINLFHRPVTSSWVAVPVAFAMYAIAVIFMRPRWRKAVERRKPIVHLFMPSNAAERAWWIAVSILAGVSEEITWRGVQPALLTALIGNPIAGVAVAALTFGFAHMIQGWKSAGLIAVFALGFQAIVWLSGSLYLAMAVHLAYDITAGMTYGRLGRELGYQQQT